MANNGEDKKCFVIGPIGAEGSPERADADWLLQGIVQPALENDPFNYDVQRADQIAEPGLITDQIIGAVIEADLVVADLTGANPNAFYELAIRHMEERAVIHMAKKGQPLPFDIKDYRAVFYSRELPRDLDEAREALRKQVEAVESPEYKPSNPITKARGVLELARTGDPRDKILADLMEGHRRLETRVNSLEPVTVAPGWSPDPKHQAPPAQIGSAQNTGAPGRTLITEPLPVDLDTWGAAGAKPAPAEEEDGS